MNPFQLFRPVLLNRRECLRLLVGLAAWLPAPVLLAASRQGDLRTAPPALGAFLDTLLPGDESPSATQVGTEHYVLDEAQGNPRLQRLVEMGCAWLDRQANSVGSDGFAGLDEPRQIALVTAMEQAPARSLPRVFFREVRRLAFRHYYAQSAAWGELGYAGPPQPAGFVGHDQPPAVAG